MSVIVPVPPAPPLPPISSQGLNSSGPVTFNPDATYDIGASGTSRPNNLWLAANATVGGTLSAGGGITSFGAVTLPSIILSLGGGAIRGGSGAPGTGMGAVGDFYFRMDTPATANQRIYVKTAASVWTGIL